MVDTRVTSNGAITVWWVPAGDMDDWRAPSADTINDYGVDLTEAIAWDSYDLGATASNDMEDRSILDKGNAQSRGYQQFSATLAFFRDTNPDDLESAYVQAFETFRTPRQYGYLITRILQKELNTSPPAAPGQWISVYKFVSDAVADDTEGEDSYKLNVEYMPQGDVKVYTMVKDPTGEIEPSEDTVTLSVGDVEAVVATYGTKNLTQGADWKSDDTSVASVTNNGVIKGVSVGTATVTASHPAIGTSAEIDVTVGN